MSPGAVAGRSCPCERRTIAGQPCLPGARSEPPTQLPFKSQLLAVGPWSSNNMHAARLLIGFLTILLTGVCGNPDAKRLYDNLLRKSHYNKLIRPVGNNTEKLTVRLGLRLSQLIDVVSTTCSNLSYLLLLTTMLWQYVCLLFIAFFSTLRCYSCRLVVFVKVLISILWNES